MPTVPVPIGPRAMLQRDSRDPKTSTSLLDPIFYTASRELYPRLALFEALAGFQNEHERRTSSGDDLVEARRDFLDSFAYICDAEKGGATVTAAGLQRLDLSNILWLAANEGIRSEVEAYAEIVLFKLKSVDATTRKVIEEEVFDLAVKNCDSRIQTYKKDVKTHARNCRMQLRKEPQNETVAHLRRTLKKISEPPSSMSDIEFVDYCYSVRRSEFSEIRKRSKKPQDDFQKLSHFIWRLGATRSAVHAVIKGIIEVPSLRRISCIRVVEAPSIRKVIMDQGILSPYEIVRKICEDRASQNPLQNRAALHSLVELDLPNGVGARTLALENTVITRVHAELQIADAFGRDGLKFVDSDKYIGCSKPACYFCFNWLSSHKHGYVPPRAHYKIIPGCRGPDNDINESGAAILKDSYAKLCAKLGQDILDFLLKLGTEDTQAKYQYQSTEGSTYAQSRVSLMPFS